MVFIKVPSIWQEVNMLQRMSMIIMTKISAWNACVLIMWNNRSSTTMPITIRLLTMLVIGVVVDSTITIVPVCYVEGLELGQKGVEVSFGKKRVQMFKLSS